MAKKIMLTREFKKIFIEQKYDEYEAAGLTRNQAARSAESEIKEAEKRVRLALAFRNDISTHMGKPKETFDRGKHTHRFGNL